MQKIKVVINNESGLHARPATQLAQEALKYQSYPSRVVNEDRAFPELRSVLDR